MSQNEIAIFTTLFGFGITSGITSGIVASKRSKGLLYGLFLGLLMAIGIPMACLFVMTVFDVWARCSSIWEVAFAGFGVTLLYGLGLALVGGPSSMLASSATFLVLRQCAPKPRK